MKTSTAIKRLPVAAVGATFVVLGVTIANVQASTFTYIAGVNDNFSLSNGTELSSPSASLLAFATNSGAFPSFYTNNFDDSSIDKQLFHTFTGLPSNITSATLEFRAKPNGGGSDNDAITLAFAYTGSTINPPYFVSRFGATGILPNLWDTTNYPSGQVFTLNLAALPPSQPGGVSNLLPGLNSNGFLDIRINDDTSVDYLKLTLTTSVPESSSILGLGLIGALGVVCLVRRSSSV
ncbi:MAG: PEP-CTERM sorting domain-containing protein [Microcystis sp.]|jgi:hypothetical protein|uniref:PEP-CTERM sorting domain-containing protein n=1 Tax=Microcystis sp. TaxID=1127 RepID=UPI003918B38E